MDSMPMSMPGMSMPGPMPPAATTTSSAAHGNHTTSLTSTSQTPSATQSAMGAIAQPALNGTGTGMASMPMMMTMGNGCKISMLWNWNTVDACFLSESWQIKSAGGFAGLCIGVILLVILLEFLRRVAKFYDNHIYRAHQFRAVGLAVNGATINSAAAEEGHAGGEALADPSTGTGRATAPVALSGVRAQNVGGAASRSSSSAPRQPLLAKTAAASYLTPSFMPSVKQQAIRALIHTLQFAVGYWIMLLAMYYNGYILICILLGEFIGAFVLRWERIGGSELERPGEVRSETTGCHG